MEHPLLTTLLDEINKIDHTTMIYPQEANNAVDMVLDHINEYGHAEKLSTVSYALSYVKDGYGEIVNISVYQLGGKVAENVSIYFRNKTITYVSWQSNGKLHRYNKPAVIRFYPDGKVWCNEWHEDGKKHRVNGPAKQYWREDGTVSLEEWVIDGDLHRKDGPARRHWYTNGTVSLEEWCVKGKPHRLDGPAYIEWDENGTLHYAEWRFYGIEITIEIDMWATNMGIRFNNMSPEEIALFKITWADNNN